MRGWAGEAGRQAGGVRFMRSNTGAKTKGGRRIRHVESGEEDAK